MRTSHTAVIQVDQLRPATSTGQPATKWDTQQLVTSSPLTDANGRRQVTGSVFPGPWVIEESLMHTMKSLTVCIALCISIFAINANGQVLGYTKSGPVYQGCIEGCMDGRDSGDLYICETYCGCFIGHLNAGTAAPDMTNGIGAYAHSLKDRQMKIAKICVDYTNEKLELE